MKKNLLLRLCLIIIALLSFHSCRQDLLPEKETYNNSSAFQLTSKRISLNEAKHKMTLLPELEMAEKNFKAFAKSNTSGKTGNYGNDFSIDTENVIYIEHGPNYHTYTFSITRENAPENAPLENLVLSPVTDGTYRKLLMSYDLSADEKAALQNGENVDTKGKVTVTDLGTTTASPISGKSNCQWMTITTYTVCSANEHSNGEGGKICKAAVKSQQMNVYLNVCDGDGSDGGGAGTPSGPGNPNPGQGVPGGGGDPDEGGAPGGSGTEPCDGTGVLTAPQTPTNGTSDGGCGNGVPTIPNPPLKNKTPCEKIKIQRTDTDFNNKITSLQGKTGLKKETGYIQRADGQYTYKDNASATDQANELSLPNPTEPENKDILSYLHTHVNDYTYDNPTEPGTIIKKGFKIFSPADIVYFMDMIKNAQDAGRPLGDVYAVMVSSLKNYQITFTGNQYQIKTFTDAQRDAFKNPYIKYMLDNESQSLEFKFLKFIDEKMNLKGISLYRMNSDGTTTEIKLNADKTDTTETNCPQ